MLNYENSNLTKNSSRSIAGIQLKIKEEETLRALAEKDIQLAKKSFQLNFFYCIGHFHSFDNHSTFLVL